VEGKVTDLVVLPLPSTEKEATFGYAAEFRLSDDQAQRGPPVMLLWAGGRFIEPAPHYADAATQRALIALGLGDAEAFRAALDGGASLEALSRDGCALVHYAADLGAVAGLRELTQRQPKLASLADLHGWQPLHHAASQGRKETVSLLIAARAPVNPKPGKVDPPLLLAVAGGHAETVSVLLASRASVRPEGTPRDPLALAIGRGDVDIAAQLTGAKARYDFKSPRAGRELLAAAVRGNIEMVRWLIAQGVDPNADVQGNTALALAASEGDAAAARALLDAGAQVGKAAKNGFTALMGAARAGNVEYARVLLEAGADPKAATESATTALHLAAQANSAELVELLLERGADIAARSKLDFTALEVALLSGAARSAQVLARHGATIMLSHPSAEAMLAAAVRNDVPGVIEAALKEGWPADSRFAGVWPAARVAEIFNSRECLQLLLAAGAEAPSATKPMALASARELDAPIKPARNAPVIDPRGADEVFEESVVFVSMLVDSEGRPHFPKAESLKDPRLARAAMESMMNWRFTSLRRKGEPVAARVQVPVTFVASSRRTFELDRLSQVPVATRQSAPVYPFDLKRAGITGRTTIGFTVGTDGNVHDVEILDATHPLFGEAGAAAVRTWQFKPGMIDGEAVNTRMKQPLSFTLNEY
jgi:TonB family protein